MNQMTVNNVARQLGLSVADERLKYPVGEARPNAGQPRYVGTPLPEAWIRGASMPRWWLAFGGPSNGPR